MEYRPGATGGMGQTVVFRWLVWAACGLGLAATAASAQVRVPDLIAEARRLYNERRYEEAAKVAAEARAIPELAPEASVVYARALLERYRETSDRATIDQAREALKRVDSAVLGRRDAVEFLIALGQALYLDDQFSLGDRYSAAAAQFELALASADVLDVPSRDLLFDWWALSLDRQAQQGPEPARRAVYARILERSEQELATTTASLSAAYWLAAAARGVDDLPRALGAATAGWIRTGSMGAPGAKLRDDLDRLVREVLLPERARQLAPNIDPKPALMLLETQWQEFKAQWGRDADTLLPRLK
jgi:hypothetical protein